MQIDLLEAVYPAKIGAPAEVRGPATVAENFKGRDRGARVALMYGRIGAVWAPGGRPRVAFDFVIKGGRIAATGILADPTFIAQIEVVLPGD